MASWRMIVTPHPRFTTCSFSTASIRDCQPFPPALKKSSTCGESRMLTACFGASDFGRPRRSILGPSNVSASRNQSSVNSGASSSSRMPASRSSTSRPKASDTTTRMRFGQQLQKPVRISLRHVGQVGQIVFVHAHLLSSSR